MRQLKGPAEKRDIMPVGSHGEAYEKPCPGCQGTLIHGWLTSCPDGIQGCLVAHVGLICKSCFAEYTDAPPMSMPMSRRSKAEVLSGDSAEEKLIGWPVEEKVGLLVVSRYDKGRP